jgi:hypothetical protein
VTDLVTLQRRLLSCAEGAAGLVTLADDQDAHLLRSLTAALGCISPTASESLAPPSIQSSGKSSPKIPMDLSPLLGGSAPCARFALPLRPTHHVGLVSITIWVASASRALAPQHVTHLSPLSLSSNIALDLFHTASSLPHSFSRLFHTSPVISLEFPFIFPPFLLCLHFLL